MWSKIEPFRTIRQLDDYSKRHNQTAYDRLLYSGEHKEIDLQCCRKAAEYLSDVRDISLDVAYDKIISAVHGNKVLLNGMALLVDVKERENGYDIVGMSLGNVWAVIQGEL